MSGKHTPGPWHVNPRASYSVEAVRFGHGGGICSTGGYSFNNADGEDLMNENIANARLIAQSPEMARLIRERLRQVEAGEVQRTALDDNFAAVLDKAGVTE